MGSLDQHCSSPSFTWSVHTKRTPGINFTGRHPGHWWPYGSACAWCILLTPLGLTPMWVLFWVIPRHSTAGLYLWVKYWKGKYSVTIVTSVPLDMEWVLRSWPCYELHALVASFEEIWESESCLYSQTPLLFWQAMAGCIAIGSRAAAKLLVHILVLHKTNGYAVTLRD